MAKFGFSVPPVKGGLTRIVLVMRRTKSFVISVVDKLGFTIVKVHDNIIGFFSCFDLVYVLGVKCYVQE